MKRALIFTLALICLLSACRKQSAVSTALSGRWVWVSAYNVGFEISPVRTSQGVLNFAPDSHWSRAVNNIIVDSGEYAVSRSVTLGIDSISFYRSTPPPPYPILDSTYAYFSLQGNTLQLGALNSPPQPVSYLYGSVDVYARE